MSEGPGTHSGKQNTMEGSTFEPVVAQSSPLPSTNDVQITIYLVFLMTIFLLYTHYREAVSIDKVQNFFSVNNFNILLKFPIARREPKTNTVNSSALSFHADGRGRVPEAAERHQPVSGSGSAAGGVCTC